jgi:hypothetical protein
LRPDFDLDGFTLMTEIAQELCNTKSNNSSISTKDVSKEVQNFLITIFDSYNNSIKYCCETAELLKSIYDRQKQLWLTIDFLPDYRRREVASQKKIAKFINLIDNLDDIGALEDTVEELTQELVAKMNLGDIDMNTLNDICIEENSHLYFKSVPVKYTKASLANQLLGRGVKLSTYVYILRLHERNRLTNRKGFIRGNIRLQLLEEMRSVWKGTAEGLTAAFISGSENTSEYSKEEINDPKEKYMKDYYYSLEPLFNAIDDDKKGFIYEQYSEHQNNSRKVGMRVSKMLYSKNEFKAKCVRMNQFYISHYQIKLQNNLRNQINCLEGPLTVNTYQRNLGLHRQFHQTPNTGSCLKQLEQLLSLEDITHIRTSQIQKGFRMKKDDDYKLKVILMADTKCVLEYLLVMDSLLQTSISGNSAQWSETTCWLIRAVYKIFSNSVIVKQVITSLGISFAPNGEYSHPLTETDQLLITAADNAPSEIVLGSDNETIVRRLIMDGLATHQPLIFKDLLEQVKAVQTLTAHKLKCEHGEAPIRRKYVGLTVAITSEQLASRPSTRRTPLPVPTSNRTLSCSKRLKSVCSWPI